MPVHAVGTSAFALRRAVLLFGTSLAAYAVVSPTAAMAQSECGAPPPGGGTVTCTPAGNPYPNGIDYDPPTGLVADLTVVLQPGVRVTNNGTPTNPNGVEIGSSTAGVDLVLQAGTDTQVNTNAANHDGVDVVSVDGTVSVAVDDVSTTGINSDAVIASGRGSVTVSGDTISTTGDFSYGVRAEEGDFILSGDPSGAIDPTRVTTNSVTTTGEGSVGISAFGQHEGVIVDSGTVATSGDGARGILAAGVYGEVRVISDSVTTQGENAVGIDATVILFPDETPPGASIHVDSGTVATTGDGASGIVASAPQNDITILSDSVSTQGDDARGISAYIEGQQIAPGKYNFGEGDIVIESGTMTTVGENSDGIEAIGTSDITITSTSVSTQGDRSAGISAYSERDGAIAITSGSATTTGDTILQQPNILFGNAHGIEANSTTGSITIDSTTVSTSGSEAIGIFAESTSGAIDITSGTVTTADGEGIDAESVSGNVTVESGSVTTTGGLFSHGIIVETDTGNIVIDSGSVSVGHGVGVFAITQSGNITIDSGAVTVTGSGAGINASGEYYTGGDIDITSGTVVTNAFFATGIDADSRGTVSIDSTSVTTTGQRAIGIEAASWNGGVTIESGAVSTAGRDSRGIKVNAYNDAAIDITSGSVTTLGDNGDGIVAVGDEEIRIASTTVSTTGHRSAGIYAYNFYDGNIIVTSGSVTTRGNSEDVPYGGSHGIELQANDGSITLTSTNVRTEGTGSLGIRTTTNAGAINITSGTVTTLGSGATGIFAQTGPGSTVPELPDEEEEEAIAPPAQPAAVAPVAVPPDISITSGTVTTSGADARGIEALTFDGDIHIQSTSVTTAGTDSDGIYAQVDLNDPGPGSITIASGTVRTAGDDSTAIHAWAPNGDVTITSTLAETTGNRSRGIFTATNSGDVVITSGTVTTQGATISEGIIAQSDTGTVTVTSQSVTIGGGTAPNTTNRAIVALTRGDGDVLVTSGSVVTSGLNAPGINATSATGDVSVTSTSITTNGASSPGLQAQAGFEEETGSVVVNSGSITTVGNSSRALFASAAVDATVTSANVTTSGTDSVGIIAFVTSGDLSITSGNVTTSGSNADAIIANRGTIAITSTGTVTTTGADADGITATTQDGPVTIDANAVNVSGAGSNAIVINSAAASSVTIRGLTRSSQAFTVQADGGPATIGIVSGGTLRGRVDLTEGADRINNAGTFDAIGTSLFGGGADIFNNSGVTRSVNGAAVLTGVDTFNSTGRIEMNDGAAGDRLTIGGTYNGQTGARLAIDVDFNAQTADVLVTGLATGTTAIEATAIGQSQGGFGSTGILLVDAAAGTQSSAFSLAGGQATTSNAYVTSGLVFDAANFDFLLFNSANQPVFETALFGEMFTDLWYRSADAVAAQLDAARGGGNQGGTNGASELMAGGRLGGWVQILGGERDREASQTFAGTVFDVSYEQDYQGVQGGIDHQTGPVIFGITFGIGRSEAAFETSFDTLEFETMNAGAYAEIGAGSFFANLLAKVDWIDAETDPGPGLATEFDATAIGIRGQAGFRFPFGRMWAEPSVSLTWTDTSIDDFTSGGATVSFEDATSLRGALGLRVGGDLPAGTGTLSPFIGIQGIDEFEGDGRNDFTFGSTLALEQQAPGTYARASAGLTYRTGSIEAFVRGELDFGGETDGRMARAGLRLRF
ncbi:MAG TPA: autotransporter domain-containing protein [Allosphingosinicella sp.]|jgi:hypothetical protein